MGDQRSIADDVYEMLHKWNSAPVDLYKLRKSTEEITLYIEDLLDKHGQSLDKEEGGK